MNHFTERVVRLLKLALIVIIFISILFLIFNFTNRNEKKKDLNSCLAGVFNKSSLSYEDQCIKFGGIVLPSGICNFYSLREKATSGDLNIDPEITECLKMSDVVSEEAGESRQEILTE